MSKLDYRLTPLWYVCKQFDLSYFEFQMTELFANTGNCPIPQEEFYQYALEYGFCFGKKQLSFIFFAKQGSVQLNSIVYDFLNERFPTLADGLELFTYEERPLFHMKEILSELELFIKNYKYDEKNQNRILIAIQGEINSGRTFLLKTLCNNCKIPLITAKQEAVCTQEQLDDLAIMTVLYEALVCIKDYDENQALLKRMSNYCGVLFVTCTNAPIEAPPYTVIVRSLPLLNAEESLDMWQYELKAVPLAKTLDLQKIAKLYQLHAGQIKSLADCIKAEMLLKHADGAQLEESLIYSLLKARNPAGRLLTATAVISDKTFEDLVLPQTQKQQLIDICGYAKNKDTVYHAWGFAQKLSYGRGMSILFYGASGTGKTMAASVMANELGLQLYRVDLSQIISKYIGETQKNIAQIFDIAKKSNCILLFDEADALFAKRSEGGDSQDKYSNAEIAFLLQKTEDYDGICILCTNLLHVFDDAFRRRIAFMINFPFPDSMLRKQLWQNIFPKKAPVEGLDYETLSEFELSGASIKNCALHAALLSANKNENIKMKSVLQAIKYEYQKQGKSMPRQIIEVYRIEI